MEESNTYNNKANLLSKQNKKKHKTSFSKQLWTSVVLVYSPLLQLFTTLAMSEDTTSINFYDTRIHAYNLMSRCTYI